MIGILEISADKATAAVMDAALLLIAGNETVSYLSPETSGLQKHSMQYY